MNIRYLPLCAFFAAFASACGAGQPTPVEPVPAQSTPRGLTQADCTFPIFDPTPAPGTLEGVCEPIAYSSELCKRIEWFENEERVPSGTVCLGFQKPHGKKCADDSDNIDCFLEKNPKACNFLQSSEWSPCLNELYMTCIEKGDLSGGKPRWVTPPSKIPLPAQRFATANEVCHWYKHMGKWPEVEVR